MKRYLTFYGDAYYPNGGMGDFIGDYDTQEEAVKVLGLRHLNHRPDDEKWEWAWGQVWDTAERKEAYAK